MDKASVTVDGITFTAAITSPAWLTGLEWAAQAILLMLGIALATVRLRIALREWREKRSKVPCADC